MKAQNIKDMNVLYNELCKALDGIADFRAKLLALLPIASGAGIFLLMPDRSVENVELSHLLPIGIFGVLITVGLFLYELRGIQKCNAFIESAIRVEEKLAPELGPWEPSTFGQAPYFRALWAPPEQHW